jgi:hypothetical protein
LVHTHSTRLIPQTMARVFNCYALVALALLLLEAPHARAGLLSALGWKGRAATSDDGNEGRPRKLLPKVPPHPDTCYLLTFVSDNNDMCNQMEPVVERLEEDLDTTVRRINIYRRREFMTLLDSIGFNEGGQLPFYYNRRTGQAVCGPTSYLNLKRWGTGDLRHLFQDPPENQYEQEPDPMMNRREVGLKGFVSEKIKSLEKKGREKVEKETSKRAARRSQAVAGQEGGAARPRRLGQPKASGKAADGGDAKEVQEAAEEAPQTEAAKRREARQLARQNRKK